MFAFITTGAVALVTALVKALVVYILGKRIINKLVSLVESGKFTAKMEPTVKSFVLSFVKLGLTALLLISVINILGVPMTSIITVLASCGVAVGLAMQGALSNLAGGIMLMFFKPFKRGDYVDAAGVSGTVREITLFYTVIVTVDNKVITVPNGSLMNANVTNYSVENLRRVDLAFSCAKSENPRKIQEIMLAAINANEKVLKDEAHAPFARLSGGTAQSMDFTVRAWVNNADYWTVFFDLTQGVTEALGAAGVKAPAYRVIEDKQ